MLSPNVSKYSEYVADFDSPNCGDISFLAEVTFFIWYHKMFPNISVFTGITFDVMLLVHSIINLLFSIFSIFNLLFLTVSLKLCGFKLKNFRIRFSSYCIFCKSVYQLTKASNFFYEILRLFTSQNLRNTTTFWITKIYESIENLLIL